MSWRIAGLLALVLVPLMVLARVVQDPDTGTATWDASRASGFVGYLLLWLSVMVGIALHLRVRPFVTLGWMLEAHRIVSTLALTFVAVHVAGLLLDPVVTFRAIDGFVPFTTEYRPVQVGIGTIAQWLLVVVLATTALAPSLPWTAWRRFHYLSFPCYVLALLHSVTSGTDTAATASIATYAVTAALLTALCVVRIAGRGWATAGEAAPLHP